MKTRVADARILAVRTLALLGFDQTAASVTADRPVAAASRGVATFGSLPRISAIAERLAQRVHGSLVELAARCPA